MTNLNTDTAAGLVGVVAGSTGLTLQLVFNVLSLTVILVNLFLAIGGLVLLWFRIHHAWANYQQLRQNRRGVAQDAREARKQ